MSNFRTRLNPSTNKIQLCHEDRILCFGSCFAQHIGDFFEKYKFQSLVNPFGILYNPISIIENLNRVLKAQVWNKEELISYNDLWHSFDHHSSFSGLNAEITFQKINASFKDTKNWISQTNCIIITFGTAFIYQLQNSGKVVANCHKFPASHFKKRILEIDEIVEAFDVFIEKLLAVNDSLEVILTVSPIRHLRDGMVENQKSKATLLLAIHKVKEKYSNVAYFPAYEIMMDDLRDYRFYATDMVHPSEAAVDYIKNQFSDSFISKNSQDLIKQIAKIVQASEHRPFNPVSSQHQDFVKQQLINLNDLESEFSFLNFKKERSIFEKQLTTD